MMKKFIYISMLLLLFSCKEEIINCENLELGNKIVIPDWGVQKVKKSDIKLFVYDSSFTKKTDSIPVENITLFNNTQVDYGRIEFSFFKKIYSNNNYRLFVSDSLIYNISDIKIYSKTVMIGMRQKKECLIESLKINNREIKSGGIEISFGRNLLKKK